MKTLLLKTIPLLLIMWPVILFPQTIATTAVSVTSCPAQITVPINVTNCNGIGSISLKLNYNSTLLTYVGYQNVNSALSSGMMAVNSTGSSVFIGWASTTPANVGNGTLIELIFSAVIGYSNLNWDTQPGTCEYTDHLGNILPATFNNGTVTIDQPPQIVTHPLNNTVPEGQNSSFSTSASGAGLAYLWQISTNNGSTWNDLINDATYSGVTTSTLYISSVLLSFNGYKYRCWVTGTCSPPVYSNAATLIVTEPVITTLPNLSICPGSIIIPVLISQFDSVASFSLAFSYNTSALIYNGYQEVNGALSGGTFEANANGGKVFLSWYSPSQAFIANDTLVEIIFTALTNYSDLIWDISTPGNCEYSGLDGNSMPTIFNNGGATIYGIPAVVSQPVNKTIAKGQNTTFDVGASGSGLSYSWQISTDEGGTWADLSNGGSFWNVTTPNLQISNAQLNLSGYQFRCRVSGYCQPIVYSNAAILTVLPNIFTICQTISGCPGELVIPVNVADFIGVASFSMVLEVNPAILTFTGIQNLNPALTGGVFSTNCVEGNVFISWYNTSPATLPNESIIFELKFNGVAGGSALNWDNQTPGYCEYTDINGQVIFSTWLNGSATVFQSPTITSHPLNSTIYSGGSTNFSISANGTGLSYLWQVSTNGGNTWSDLTNTPPYSGAETPGLTINPADLTLNGHTYRCNITGTCIPSSISNSAQLTVTPAAVTTTIASVSNSCTGNLLIPVTVANCNNIGGISLTLNYDTTKLTFDSYEAAHPELSQGLLIVIETPAQVRLTWISTMPANIGSDTLIIYRFKMNPGNSTSLNWDIQTPGNCEYSDINGSVLFSLYNNGNIGVVGDALIVNAGYNAEISPGDSVQLNGIVNGGAQPYSHLWTPSTSLDDPTLLNPIAFPTSNTVYKLTTTDLNGCSGTDLILISVVSNLPTVSTSDIIDITFNSASGGGNVIGDGGAPVNVRGICWGLISGPTIYGYHTSDGSGTGEFLSGLVGLLDDTIYYVRAYATNSNGTSYGPQVSFSTLPIPTNQAPTINPISNPTPILEDVGEQSVNISGISDGNIEMEQNISISASSSNVNIVPNPQVSYIPNESIGIITYTPMPNAYGSVTITITVMDDGGVENGGINATQITFDVLILPVNDAPIANAGPNQSIISGQLVTLNGSSSHDIDGDSLSFHWSSPPGVTLSDSNVINPTFTPPASCISNIFSFSLVVNDGSFNSSPDNVAITATATPPDINIIPASLSESLISGTASTKTLKVHNLGICNLSFSMTPQATWLTVAPGSGFIVPGDSLTIMVYFSAVSLYAGFYGTEITVNSNDPDESVLHIPVTLMVSGDPQMVLSDTTFDYGSVFIGQSVTQTVTISNTGTDSLHVYNITSNKSQYSVNLSAFVIPPQASMPLVINFTPSFIGQVVGNVTIYSDNPGQSTSIIHVSGIGLVPPVISVLPSSLNATLYQNQVSMQQLAIHNTGGNALLYYVIEDVPWLNVIPLSGSVSPGNSVSLSVSFSTSTLSPGYYSTIIYINSNDPESPVVSIPALLHILEPLSVQASATPLNICLNGSALLDAIPVGGSGNYTYLWSSNPSGFNSSAKSPTVTPLLTTTYTVNVTDGYDMESSSVVVTIWENEVPSMVTNMLPADNSFNLDIPILLSWAPSENATNYDLFIWKSNEAQPSVPIAADLSQINFLFQGGGYNYGDTCKWQVVAKNPCFQTPGNIYTFSLSQLSDLVVNTIQVPANPSSGQAIELSWSVFNQGNNGTQSFSWIDAIYLSQDDILNTEVDNYLGGKTNLTSLAENSGYNQTQTVTLPEAMFGAYYIIVKADYANQLPEMIESNNVTTQPIDISLTPPPDLVVDSIGGIPTIAFSGQTITVKWRTINSGSGAVLNKSWVDNIYLSQQPVFNPQTASLLGQSFFNYQLPPESSYLGNFQVSLPDYISGNYYMYIFTDANNNVFEHANEFNNIFRSEVFEIILTPPPDLTVIDIQHPINASNSESMTINWILKNNGAGATDTSWHDKIFLCPQPVFNQSISIEIGTKPINTVLQPGETISSSLQVATPDNITGIYYLFIYTDYFNKVFEHQNESNNIIVSEDQFEIKHADLKIFNSIVSDSAWSGQTVMANWKVVNLGSGTILGKAITDKVYLSESKEYPMINPIDIGSLTYTNIILHNDTLQKSISVTIPDGFEGKHFLFVCTNVDTNVFENQIMGNNYTLDSIYIKLSDYPDLVIDSVAFPLTVTLGFTENFYCRIKNGGDTNIFGKAWKDVLYVSDSLALDTAQAVELYSTQINQSLNISDTYSSTYQITLPIAEFQGFNQGYLHYYTDLGNNVFENHENNNIASSGPIQFIVPPKVDLMVTSASTTTDTTQSGQNMQFSYMVKNIGTATNIWGITQWADAIYISFDTVWDEYDIMISQWIIIQSLPSNSTYLENKSIAIPPGISGDYYFLVVSDHSKLNNDLTYVNNSKPLTGSVPIHIRPTYYPDLKADAFHCPFNGNAGQPVKFTWQVKNVGEGPTTNNSWTDKIYLSNDFVIGSDDIILATNAFSGTLNVNDTYLDSVEVSLPTNTSGNYIVIFKTDANSNVFETGQGEINNVAFANINIILPPPCDLTLSAISFPATAEIGQMVTIQYNIKNIGVNPAAGNIKDILYISPDSLWDYLDPIFGPNNNYINLAPLESQASSLNSIIPGLKPGDYFVAVQTNVLNNIPEGNTQNNTGISGTKITVTMPQLILGITHSGTLNNTAGKYFEIDIPQTFEGETMIITLKGDSINGSNELYMCFDSIPTRAIHTFSATEPFMGNQELIVPELHAGKYYLLVYGSTSSGNSQNISLLADILPFEIRSVDAVTGGNTGNVTIVIQGAKFEEDMLVKLTNGSQEEYIAANISWINSTRLFATFNLSNANLGIYDVVTIKSNNASAILPGGFEIITGSPGNGDVDTSGFVCSITNIGFEDQINTDIQHPATTRPNRIVVISIHFQNNGNVDIPSPARLLVSLSGVPLSMNSNDFSENKKEIFLEFEEHNGPPGILRPGAQGTVSVYTKATIIANLQFVLTR